MENIDNKFKKDKNNRFYLNFKQVLSEKIKNLLVDSTLNFSADALKKVIEGFYEHLITKQYNSIESEELLIRKIKEVSIE